MADTPDMSSIQTQLTTIQDKLKDMETTNQRVSKLKTRMDTTQDYLEQILHAVKTKAGEATPESSIKMQPDAAKQPGNTSKASPLITILDDKERYSIKLDEPGILAGKPGSIPVMQQRLKMKIGETVKEENQTDATNNIHQGYHNRGSTFKPKLELHMFNGTNPRGWIKRCQKYFTLLDIPGEQRIDLATMHLEGKAETWFDSYILQKHRISWHEFTANLCHRFSDREYMDVIDEFNKLIQKGTVEEYQDKFEELKPYIIQQNPYQEESYFVSSFLSGLKEELRHRVKTGRPTSLAEAYRLARLHELALEVETKRLRPKTYSYTNQNPTQKSWPQPISSTPKITPQNTTKQTLLDYRRAHNLCFKCGDKFIPGHQCTTKQLHSMEEEDLVEVTEEEELCKETEGTGEGIVEEELEISMNALTGSVGHNTLRIQGTIKGRPMSILVDNGSTHSFLTPGWAKEGIEVVPTNPLVIIVANGEKLYSNAQSKQLRWKMQGHQFEHDFRVLSMGGSDMVLGVDWMRRYSPIIMDFKLMTLSFQRNEELITLKGGFKPAKLQFISGEKFQKISKKESELTGEIYLLSSDTRELTVRPELIEILAKFEDVFSEPTGMPPSRFHDHAITLKEGSQPVNLRPYRFPHNQKAEVERQITEMLTASIIRTSKSPFASPCLLVKKKDGSWRFCVDYRQLNAITVKNKFPIPVVEELLDELEGANFFSKIDLRAGYWQIRVKDEDVHKTAFRTHHGHFEFKVMPFGLTNAPATFQSLMNAIFEPYLRRFVLVFFDDILIYSSTLQDHCQHLQLVLSTLRTNQLFARKTKCFFGQEQIDYLGHTISANGVATDSSKITAMKDWPVPKTLKALRGFLGLTGYYRRFIRNYGSISKPLTTLLKKNNFHWSTEAETAFTELKTAMCTAPVLALPNFTKPFSLETDASSRGIGAVLSQEGRPVAFLSKALGPRHADLSVYEREYLAILLAVTKWRHYLEGGPFIIKTDHEALKHLLEQKLTTTV
ncbi:hypothetical protein HRI_002721400 [Hibiscus trionum]|uniref:Reverse transcriptase domain-containing protein n=1 Tax=Hibiscus trionum TaxID=183268 RepID=A0A9W7I8I7_HIBTR|nr:hypothetical protein HRI_002721400 [Hibiscus trionum]